MKRKTLIIAHLLIWIYHFIIFEIVSGLVYKSSVASFNSFFSLLALSNYLIFGIFFYFNYYVVLPLTLNKKNYSLAILSWILLCIFFVSIRYLVQEYLFMKYFSVCNFCDGKLMNYVFSNFTQCLSWLIFPGTMVWLVDNWFTAEKQKLVLVQEKLKAESAFLQSQLTPHFLFNNLHTIYSMVFHQSTQALTAIKKLSNILRYAINETRRASVDLALEVQHLEDYIILQKFRVVNPAVEMESNCDREDYQIQPLLLITLVENAFKHGISNDPENPIKVILNVETSLLTFTVENKINPNKNTLSLGTGLGNIVKRLELYYNEKHAFSTTIQNEKFITHLKLNLEQ